VAVPAQPDADRVRFTDGTHRVCPPEETWARVQPLLALAGVTRVADLTWLDTVGIPTWQAVRPLSLTLSVSQGKGASHPAARVSAVMESLETWHAEYVPPALVARSAREIAGELSYDPENLGLAAGSVYSDGARIDWAAAEGVVTGRHTWVPVASVLLDTTVGTTWCPPLFEASTNGLASGNTVREAMLHGLYELLERDSRMRCLETARARLLDVDSVRHPGCRELVRRLTRGDNSLRVLDVTVHDRLPCFVAQLGSRGLLMTFAGAGCHLDPVVALSRALTEAAQSRLTVISGAREDIRPSTYRRIGRPLEARREDPPRLGVPVTSVRFDRHRDTSTMSVERDVAFLAARVTDLTGVEPVAAPLHRPGSDLPVVRVLAPGLAFDPSLDHRMPLVAADV
jgi:YcaO-like protein with predicted kinase domain